jgi:DNA-binding NarL/FixJ family response regulator
VAELPNRGTGGLEKPLGEEPTLNVKVDLLRVLLVDNHKLFRDGLAEIFAAEDDMRVVGQAKNALEAIALAETQKPDAILLDIEMPLMGTEETLGRLLHASPSSKILVLTMYDEPHLVRRVLTSGASAFLTKYASRDELIMAMRTVHRIRDRVVLSISRRTAERLEEAENGMLSAREFEVLVLTARGMSNSQIALHLYISEATVKRHLTNIYAKLEVSSRVDAAKEALKSGLLTLRDLSEPNSEPALK